MSLFAAISGGNDWMTYGQVLRDGPGEVYFLIFMLLGALRELAFRGKRHVGHAK